MPTNARKSNALTPAPGTFSGIESHDQNAYGDSPNPNDSHMQMLSRGDGVQQQNTAQFVMGQGLIQNSEEGNGNQYINEVDQNNIDVPPQKKKDKMQEGDELVRADVIGKDGRKYKIVKRIIRETVYLT